jgi:hypothetical protein
MWFVDFSLELSESDLQLVEKAQGFVASGNRRGLIEIVPELDDLFERLNDTQHYVYEAPFVEFDE